MALLEICECCGKHGRFVLDNGYIGPEFAFVRQGIDLIQSGVERGIFTPAEGRTLESEVISSTLPITWEDQNLGILWLANEQPYSRRKVSQPMAIDTPFFINPSIRR